MKKSRFDRGSRDLYGGQRVPTQFQLFEGLPTGRNQLGVVNFLEGTRSRFRFRPIISEIHRCEAKRYHRKKHQEHREEVNPKYDHLSHDKHCAR